MSTITPPAAAPASWEDFVDVFYTPAKVLGRCEPASWAVPFVVVSLATAVMSVPVHAAMAPIMDAEFARHFAEMQRTQPGVDPAMLQRGRELAERVTLFTGVFTVPFRMLVTSLMLWAVGALFGARMRLGAATRVAVFSFVPAFVQQAVVLLQTLVIPDTALTSVRSLALGPARFLDVASTPAVWLALADTLDVFSIWRLAILFAGLRSVGRLRAGDALCATAVIWTIAFAFALWRGS